MREVISSRVELAERATAGRVIYHLTNGLSWAGDDRAWDAIEVATSRATLHHDGHTFFLEVDGVDGSIEVTLVACRRKVWDHSLWSEPALALA